MHQEISEHLHIGLETLENCDTMRSYNTMNLKILCVRKTTFFSKIEIESFHFFQFLIQCASCKAAQLPEIRYFFSQQLLQMDFRSTIHNTFQLHYSRQ